MPSYGRSPFLRVLLLAGLLAPTAVTGQEAEPLATDRLVDGAVVEAEPAPNVEAEPAPNVLFLHTYFFPYEDRNQHRVIRPLIRELPRQALLITAREELGLITRDETLGEVAPEGVAVKHATFTEKAVTHRERMVMRIVDHDTVDWRDQKRPTPWGVKPTWQNPVPLNIDLTQMYASLVPVLELETRGKLVRALGAIGFEPDGEIAPEPTPVERGEAPPAEWLAALDKPDYIAQFGVVKACHERIAAEGETQERLGLLVRGYTNLALLTNHQWNAVGYAYAARALLYAQRLAASSGEEPSDFALWHRAYAWGVIGIHNIALVDLETLATRGAEPPDWALLVEPYCRYDEVAINAMAGKVEELAPWSAVLRFKLAAATRYPDPMNRAAQEVIEKAPAAFGVYSNLAHLGQTLSNTRTGARFGPRALSHFSPRSLDALPAIPERLKPALPSTSQSDVIAKIMAKDPNPGDLYTAFPGHYAEELKQESLGETDAVLSWSALGYLLGEECLLQAVNGVRVAYHGTETSVDSFVDGLMPLIESHPYAPYVESLKYDYARDLEKITEIGKGVVIRDCRGAMAPMTHYFSNVSNQFRENEGDYAWATVTRELTMSGMVETTYLYGSNWSASPSEGTRAIAQRYRAIVPHSEVGLRMEISKTEDPTLEQLMQWEEVVEKDADALRMIGHAYWNKDYPFEALINYEKSLAQLRSIDTAKSIAGVYLELNERDQWKAFWDDYLAGDDSTSGNYMAAAQVSRGHYFWAEYEQAKPYALQAAQMWSAWGLDEASRVLEALGDWEKSEYYMSEVSTNYPSYSGCDWFFWCCRTGRGNREDAHAFAARYLERLPEETSRYQDITVGDYHLMQGEDQLALQAYQKALAHYPSHTCTLMVANMARRLGDDRLRGEVLADFRQHIASSDYDYHETNLPLHEAGLALLDLYQQGDTSPEKLTQLEDRLRNIPDRSTRCAFTSIGAYELEALGQEELAVKFWRRALRLPWDPSRSSLAGFELAKRFGTSRPDGDQLTREDLWGVEEEEERKAERARKRLLEQEERSL